MLPELCARKMDENGARIVGLIGDQQRGITNYKHCTSDIRGMLSEEEAQSSHDDANDPTMGTYSECGLAIISAGKRKCIRLLIKMKWGQLIFHIGSFITGNRSHSHLCNCH